MMTPTRKSGRQPKLSARLKDFLYENDMEKIKESSPRVADKKKTEVKKEPAPQPAEKKKVPQAKKGSETKPTKAGAEVKPTKGGSETKPTKARSETKPTKARSETKPTKAGGLETKPTKTGSEIKPTKAGSEVKPTKAGPASAKKAPAKSSAVKKALQETKGSVENKKVVENKKSGQTVKPLKKEPSEIKKSAPVVKAVKKEPEVRVGEKRKISEVTQAAESPDSSAPSRKSKRTPKPSVKLEEFVYEDEREKSVEATPGKKEPKSAEKAKQNLLREEDQSDKLESPSKKPLEPRVTLSRLSTPESDSDILTSPRARVASLTSISVKKGKMVAGGSQLTVKKGKLGKVMSKSPLSSVRVKHIKTGKIEVKSAPSITNKKVFVSSNSATMRKVNMPNKAVKRKADSEITTKTGKNIKVNTKLAKPLGKGNKMITKRSINAKEIKKVEKKEIEKVLQVNKEVMTQLLNFGAEVAEAMACNNESIFSFSTKDNPLQTFRIDKQDDFSDDEVVKIIKWFEEEEEQRRAYRKRILEALRASHETNMSLYTQMLKMLQSVTAS